VKRRRQTATDVRIDIEHVLSEPSNVQAALAPPLQASRLPWIAAAAAALVAVALLIPTVRYLRQAPPSFPVMRFTAELGDDFGAGLYIANQLVGSGAAAVLSRNGTMLALVAIKDGVQQLYLRHLDQPGATLLAGTDGARSPFFSPDDQWIAFFADGKLKKVAVTGGAAITLCNVPDDRGGTWMDDGSIIFGTGGSSSGLLRVSSAGGTPAPLTKIDSGEILHAWPQAVRGGEAVLFVAALGGGFEGGNVLALSLRSGEKKLVLRVCEADINPAMRQVVTFCICVKVLFSPRPSIRSVWKCGVNRCPCWKT
jgi:serine/threonine-protein kinase